MGKVDEWEGALAEISADAPIVSMWISRRIEIWYGRQKVALEIQINLIESTWFYLKIIRVPMFCSNFSQVRMFCDDDISKLVPESTNYGVFWVVQCQ